MNRPLRIAMFVGSFPVVSETFILQQITGLMDLGHTVDIYADTRADAAATHPEVTAYGLQHRVTYMDMPPESAPWEMPVRPVTGHTWLPGAATSIPNWRRVARAAPKWLGCFSTSPRLAIQVLQRAQHGYRAASLSALYRLDRLRRVSPRYDVLHAHFGPVGNCFRFARDLWQAPLVVTFHGYDFCVTPREEGPAVYHALFRDADAVTVNSQYTRERVIELGCLPERVSILHVGVDLRRFVFQSRRRIGTDPVRLITVGRLVPKKGIEFALRAVASIREKHPHIQYDIVGEGPLRTELEKLVKELNLGGQVILHGAKDSRFVQDQITRAHIFMLPSFTAANGDQEGTPVSLMEAQAVGLPVLSSQHSGIPEVVKNGQSGFLVPERDVVGLAEKLDFLITHPEVCQDMGICGRKHVETEFDIRRLNRELVEIYQRVNEPLHRRRP